MLKNLPKMKQPVIKRQVGNSSATSSSYTYRYQYFIITCMDFLHYSSWWQTCSGKKKLGWFMGVTFGVILSKVTRRHDLFIIIYIDINKPCTGNTASTLVV